VTPPIPVTASLGTDPAKPTNTEIQSATSLIQSMAAQYTAPPPDITVENDKTTAVQKAIQGAQTKYDHASQALQGAQNVLHLANRDPESTPAERKSAQADYAKARAAADDAQRELNVTTDAGYMILYGEQANADMPAGMKLDDSGKVTDPGDAQHAADQQLKTLIAAFPDHPDDPNWAPQAATARTRCRSGFMTTGRRRRRMRRPARRSFSRTSRTPISRTRNSSRTSPIPTTRRRSMRASAGSTMRCSRSTCRCRCPTRRIPRMRRRRPSRPRPRTRTTRMPHSRRQTTT
jgi:hypothetical protein